MDRFDNCPKCDVKFTNDDILSACACQAQMTCRQCQSTKIEHVPCRTCDFGIERSCGSTACQTEIHRRYTSRREICSYCKAVFCYHTIRGNKAHDFIRRRFHGTLRCGYIKPDVNRPCADLICYSCAKTETVYLPSAITDQVTEPLSILLQPLCPFHYDELFLESKIKTF